MKKPTCGILDFGTRENGLNSLLKLDDVINSAATAEQLGFSRYWISEHHFSQKSLAWSNPQAVLPILASSTKKIRVGIAGILLNLYSPYHIATFFKMLNNIYGNRIDLGVANGKPNKHAIKYATGKDELDQSSAFEDKFAALLHYLRDDEDLYMDGTGVVVPPYKGHVPDVWSLSSSAYRSNDRIINLKINLSRSICHEYAEQGFAKERLLELRESYFAANGSYPKINLVVGFICDRTMQKARRTAEKFASAGPYLNLVGCPSYFQEKIAEYQELYGVDEFILYNYSVESRERNLAMRLIGKAVLAA
ncbi:LLM class flavin-dependent oxidoreductase [Dyadobacter sp. LJ53]|uniref:LLM class flavin-dependent oxidoreductase n=1 Tax=Dyadobacter chenwenxiniae TaxID=2906456 RepID=UPI001F18F7EA|nr:LLM class flavin-dependent oxidoreductase [Dyadobacter chenwenxiniae]MCF0052423.1 LLM class flavin-dependent oxidoreductase [Dyadobacter chenwenxiniae]